VRLNFENTSLGAFKYREYRIFWIAAAFSNIGMWALIFGRLWLMRTLTPSEFMLGLETAANLGPVLIFSVWGGVLADRVNRLKLVRVTRLMFAALAALTGVLIVTGVIQPWHVIVISLGTGVLLAFDIPSRAAMVATIVPSEHLAGAIAMYSIVFGVAAIIGPALFAPLVGSLGLEGLFFIIAASYVLTTAALMFMSPVGHKMESTRVSAWRGLTEGFGYLRSNRTIAGLIGLGIFGGLVGLSYQTLLPVFTDEVLGGDEQTYGNLLLGAGIGGLVATVAIVMLGKRVRPALYLTVSGSVFGVLLVVFAQLDTLAAAAFALALVGASRTIYQTMNQTLVQTLVAPEYRGRVMGISQFTWGASSLGGLLMGGLAQFYGAPFALVIGGTLMACGVAAVGTTLLRPLWYRSKAETGTGA
jgi:MFS family permease